MAGGLSTATFMGGLMQGASFANQMQQQKRANDIQDEQLSNQREDREQKKLLEDFDRETRLMVETGQMPADDFYGRYSRFGLDRIGSPEKREELMQAGALMHRAVSENKWDDKALDGINLMLKDDLAERTNKDGLQRRIIGAKQVPTGKDADGDGVEDIRMVPILEVTKKDGSKYTAPLTRQGTSSEDDELYTLNDKKIAEWHEAALNRANTAYMLEKHKDDPVAYASSLRNIVLGPSAKTDQYEIKEIYDNDTGTKRVAAIVKNTGKFSHWVGGASLNDGRGGSGSGKKGKNGALDVDGYIADRQEILTSSNFVDDKSRNEALQQVDSNWGIAFGVDPRVVARAQEDMRNAGDFGPMTYEKLAAYQAGMDKRGRDSSAVDGAIANNPDVFGSGQAAQPQPQVAGLSDIAPPRPGEVGGDVISRDVAAQVAELEQKASDPKYPENARAKFQQEADALRSSNRVAKHNLAKPTRKDMRQSRIEELQQQIAAASSDIEAAVMAKEMADLMAQQNSGGLSDIAGL